MRAGGDGRIFEVFSTQGKKHLVASRVRWDERQRLKVAQEERARRNVQEADDEVDYKWTAACEGIAKNVLKYLEDSEIMEVSTRELIEGASPVSRTNRALKIVRIARQAGK